MDWTSAPSIEVAPPEPARRPIFASGSRALFEHVESFLERERSQLPAWLVVSFAGGIAGWFILPHATAWTGMLFAALGLAIAGVAVGRRTGRAMVFAGLAMALGLGWIWWRSMTVAAPALERPQIVQFEAEVERVELRPARGDARLS